MTGANGAGVLKTYIDQLLATATDNNVVAEYAFATERMMWGCKVCKTMLTTDIPSSPEVLDYAIQEFISLHSHKGGHKDPTAYCSMCEKVFPIKQLNGSLCSLCWINYTSIPDSNIGGLQSPPAGSLGALGQQSPEGKIPINKWYVPLGATPVTADFKKVEPLRILKTKDTRRFK